MRGKGKDIAQMAEKRQRIMENGFRLFAEKGIESVTMPEIAAASNVSRASLYLYFSTKLELVIAIAAWKWDEYITWHNGILIPEELEKMTGAERLRFYLDAFLDLYRNHRNILRFNYNFNSFLQHEAGTAEQKQPYFRVTEKMREQFHELYQRGMSDGTLNPDISEQTMFSSSFHIMLAAVTRYAVGLAVVYEDGGDPESELVMLKELLYTKYTQVK